MQVPAAAKLTVPEAIVQVPPVLDGSMVNTTALPDPPPVAVGT
jgi:hypothetical protein